jgi:hypothetical protein
MTSPRERLRDALQPPVLDPALVAALVALADDLDSVSEGGRDDESARARFNELAGTELSIDMFHFSGACSAQAFVRDILVLRAVPQLELTDEELEAIVELVCAHECELHEHTFWLRLLELACPDACVSDLIYYPAPGLDGESPREIARRIRHAMRPILGRDGGAPCLWVGRASLGSRERMAHCGAGNSNSRFSVQCSPVRSPRAGGRARGCHAPRCSRQ